MFAKKKIVLNSAQGNNKRGIAEITRLDSLTSLNIKLNNFQSSNDCNYVFLLKNNDLQQKIMLDDPRDFTCDISIPIDLEKKISCLLIESGDKQIPLFWGGTETQNQVMSLMVNDPQHAHPDNNQECNFCTANHTCDDFESANSQSQHTYQSPNLNCDNTSYNNSTFCGGNSNYSSNNDYNNNETIPYCGDYTTASNCNNCMRDSKDYLINSNCNNKNCDLKIHPDIPNLSPSTSSDIDSLHGDEYTSNFPITQPASESNSQPNAQLFEQDDIEAVIDTEIIKYELIKNFEEPDFPQCQTCKYKNVFYQEKHLQEAKNQLNKIAQIQQTSQPQQNEYVNTQNQSANAQIMQDNAQKHQLYCQNLQDSCKNSNSDTQNNFDNLNNLEENNDELIIEKPTDNDPYYYKLIKAQYDDMFEKYPPFVVLSNIIENSKWIEVDGVDSPYIMGIIYENEAPKYLCYGIVQEKKQSPPTEIVDSSQWVPFDVSNEFGRGVWIMYQSADTGETIQVEVIA